jgi:hypothetical protein
METAYCSSLAAALGVKVEVFDLPPGEALVTAKDQRACDRWLASRVARFYGACAPSRALGG